MAKSKNIVERIVVGNDSAPDFVPNRENPNKWEMFKEIFTGHFTGMIGLNLLTILFFLPGIAVMVYFYMVTANANALLPYSSNLGVGYRVVTDVAYMSTQINFYYNLISYAILVPCVMVGALGLAGNFYVMRKYAWGENVRTVRDFFKGIGKNWLSFIILGLLDGLAIMFFVFNLGYYDAYRLGIPLKATMVTLSSVMLVLMAMITMFWTTQTVAYKLGPGALLRNSFLFSFGTFIFTIAILAVTLGTIALGFIPGFITIVLILFAFFGISYITSAWTAYTHYCFDRFLPKNEPSAVYVKRNTEIEEINEKKAQQKSAPVKYSNPKKKKKSIDDGATITPLSTTFNRDDLERLKKEQEEDIKAAKAASSSESDESVKQNDDKSASAEDVMQDAASENAENSAADASAETAATEQKSTKSKTKKKNK